MIRYLVRHLSQPGDIVVDINSNPAWFGPACISEGRHALMFQTNKDEVEMLKDRFKVWKVLAEQVETKVFSAMCQEE